MCFVDLTQAFDRVQLRHDKIVRKMEDTSGIIIRKMNTDNNIYSRADEKLTS